MRKYPLLLLIIVSAISATAQTTFKKNSLYVELAGNALYASLNYERQLTNKPGIGIRLGVGYFSSDEKFRISIPIAINYLFQLNNDRSFIDASLGATWSGAAGIKKDSSDGTRDYSEHILSFVPAIGYRRHTKGGFMWRVSFTPLINKYRVVPIPGVSIGKVF